MKSLLPLSPSLGHYVVVTSSYLTASSFLLSFLSSKNSEREVTSPRLAMLVKNREEYRKPICASVWEETRVDEIRGKVARAMDYTMAINPKAVPVMDSFTMMGITGTRQFEYSAYPTPTSTNPLIDPFSTFPKQDG